MGFASAVFVYGTLCRGQSNHGVVAPYVRAVVPALLPAARVYDLPYGYPGIVPGDGWVAGEWVELDPARLGQAWAALDELEDYHGPRHPANLYVREERLVEMAAGSRRRAQVYRWCRPLPGGARPVADGNWNNHRQGHCFYLAYGSCMAPDSLGETCPGAVPVGSAGVPGYRLRFSRWSTSWRGGVADIVPGVGQVEGVLWQVPLAELPALDRREGAPQAYRRHICRGVWQGHWLPVLTYVVAEKSEAEVPPAPDYVRVMLQGAGAAGLHRYARQLRERAARQFGLQVALPDNPSQ